MTEARPLTEIDPAALPFDVRLAPGPYRFEWSRQAPAARQVVERPGYTEARYAHADGTVVVLRQYAFDGSFRVMSNREIVVIDNANDPAAPAGVSVVRLP